MPGTERVCLTMVAGATAAVAVAATGNVGIIHVPLLFFL